MNTILLFIPSILAVIILVLIVKVAAVALRLTGMDEKKANFQALSALTGTGFTTKESELIVNNSKRRQIISFLMIIGYAGFITIIVSFSSSLISTTGHLKYYGVLIFLVSLLIIYFTSSNKRLTERLNSIIRKELIKSSVFEEAPIEDLLKLMEGYGLVRVTIKQNSTFINQQLREINLPQKNILILGIDRENKWNPIPKGEEIIKQSDILVIYGPIMAIQEIFRNK